MRLGNDPTGKWNRSDGYEDSGGIYFRESGGDGEPPPVPPSYY